MGRLTPTEYGHSRALTSPSRLDEALAESRERKSILLFSSGINYFRGSSGIADPDLDSTIERAQKENINIWTIYARDAGSGRGSFRTFSAQSNLVRLSEETGAKAYYLGFGEPINLKPYFDEIQMHLNNQYLLTFDSGNGGDYRASEHKVPHAFGSIPPCERKLKEASWKNPTRCAPLFCGLASFPCRCSCGFSSFTFRAYRTAFWQLSGSHGNTSGGPPTYWLV